MITRFNRKRKSLRKLRFNSCLLVLLLLSCGVVGRLQACGINWGPPSSHFDGVDYRGFVMLPIEIAEIDAGNGLKLPLRAIFWSNKNSVSPYAGAGWDVPLLESRIVQTDEKFFKLDEPGGWFRFFWRDDKDPAILHGQGGWKAQIKGNTITAWADCGSKLVFNRGRLESMQLKDKKFDFVYVDNQVKEIRQGSTPLLVVDKDGTTGEVTGFLLPGNKHVGIEQGERPVVQSINGQNIVSGMSRSLIGIIHPDGAELNINYAVDDKLYPTLKLNDRLISWNTIDYRISKDNEISYTHKSKADAGYYYIERVSSSGKEVWENNIADGIEKIIFNNQKYKTISKFRTGTLIGKVREVEEGESNKIHKTKFIYNENGNMTNKKEVLIRNGVEEVREYNYDNERNLRSFVYEKNK